VKDGFPEAGKSIFHPQTELRPIPALESGRLVTRIESAFPFWKINSKKKP
jgi:hypothetical protein